MTHTALDRRGYAKKLDLSIEQIPVLITKERHSEMTDKVLEVPSEVPISRVMKPVVAQDTTLWLDGNKSL